MSFILASDFGNLAALLVGLPVLAIALPFGAPGLFLRGNAPTAIAAIFAASAGVIFLISLPAAKKQPATSPGSLAAAPWPSLP